MGESQWHRRATAEEQKIFAGAMIADSVAKGSTGHRPDAVRGDSRKLLALSLVLAVTVPVLLMCSGGDPVLAAWSLSLLLVVCLFCFTCCFSTAATTLAIIFFFLSYGGLLAYMAGNLVSGVLGMVIMYLDSVLAAGFFGTALAQHRLGNGAAIFVANGYAPEKRDKDPLYFFLGLLTLGFGARLLWMMLPNSNYSPMNVAENLLLAVAIFLWLHISCVFHWLNGALSADESSSIILCWFAIVWMLFFFCLILGELVAVTVLWLCLLASTAFLGYCVCIHASYEQIMIRRNAGTRLLPKHLDDNNKIIMSEDPPANLDDNKALGMPMEPIRSPVSLLNDLDVNNDPIMSEDLLAKTNLDVNKALGMQLEPTTSHVSLLNDLDVNNDPIMSEDLLAKAYPDDNKALGMQLEPTTSPASLLNDLAVHNDPITSGDLLVNLDDNNELGVPVKLTRSKHCPTLGLKGLNVTAEDHALANVDDNKALGMPAQLIRRKLHLVSPGLDEAPHDEVPLLDEPEGPADPHLCLGPDWIVVSHSDIPL